MLYFNIYDIAGIGKEKSIFSVPTEDDREIIVSFPEDSTNLTILINQADFQKKLLVYYAKMIEENKEIIKMLTEIPWAQQITSMENKQIDEQLQCFRQLMADCQTSIDTIHPQIEHAEACVFDSMGTECAKSMMAILIQYRGKWIFDWAKTSIQDRLTLYFTCLIENHILLFNEELDDIFQSVANAFKKLAHQQYFISLRLLNSAEKMSHIMIILTLIAYKYHRDDLLDNKTWAASMHMPLKDFNELEKTIVSTLFDFRRTEQVDDDLEDNSDQNIPKRNCMSGFK